MDSEETLDLNPSSSESPGYAKQMGGQAVMSSEGSGAKRECPASANRGFRHCRTGAHVIKKSTAAALMLSSFVFAGEALFAQRGAAQTAQPVATRGSASSIDQEIVMLTSPALTTKASYCRQYEVERHGS